MNSNDLFGSGLFLIAGPCVVENEEICQQVASAVKAVTDRLGIKYIFKASYRKANRSRLDSFTGPGDEKALQIIAGIREKYDLPVTTDIHSAREAEMAAGYVDIIQIPAFLCRQTDLLVSAAKTGKIINVKKGQFLAPSSMKFVINKITGSGNKNILLTDRGTMFGYNDLIVDYRGLVEMRTFGYPVVLDITHSLQQPNQTSGVAGGRPEMIETIARAGIAVGADGIFMETHPDPKEAKSDGANMLPLDQVENLLIKLKKLKEVIDDF
ncbi:MAG: 3-deoxy-8-phosphooctulonate synthase [Bacteroidales bacterium]|jgi:2-dehydro-3-deoxyphosphooctonate aldolase (KDO 8-P synthase)